MNRNSEKQKNPQYKADFAIEQLTTQLPSTCQSGLRIPPLENWHPTQLGTIDIVIKANGEWWHEGRPILRQALVDLFATILWQEVIHGEVQYFLKTPVQKLKIEVEDAPLLIDSVAEVIENGVSILEFYTKTGDVVRLDDEHLISLRPCFAKTATQATDIRPYMMVRQGLTALIHRNTFYHLVDMGELIEEEDSTSLLLSSGGKEYRLTMPTAG